MYFALGERVGKLPCHFLSSGAHGPLSQVIVNGDGNSEDSTHPLGGFRFFSTWVKTHSVL